MIYNLRRIVKNVLYITLVLEIFNFTIYNAPKSRTLVLAYHHATLVLSNYFLQ